MQIPHFTSSWKHGNIKYSRQEHFFPISAKWISEVHPLLLHFIIKCRYYKLLCSFNLLHFQGRCLLSEMMEQEIPKSSNFSCFGRREHLEYFSANVWIRWIENLNLEPGRIQSLNILPGRMKMKFPAVAFWSESIDRASPLFQYQMLCIQRRTALNHVHCIERTAFLHSCCR